MKRVVGVDRLDERGLAVTMCNNGAVGCCVHGGQKMSRVVQGWMRALSLAAVSWKSSLVSFGGPRKT